MKKNKRFRCANCKLFGRKKKCPRCGSSEVEKVETPRTYAEKHTTDIHIDEQGYTMKKVDGGWIWCEGKQEQPLLSRIESAKINACARRRGVMRSSNIFMHPKYNAGLEAIAWV